MRFALSLCAAVLLPTAASGFNLAPRPPRAVVGCHADRCWQRAAQAHVRAQAPEPESDVEPSRPSALERAWQRFVLLRPGMTYEELKATTRYVTPGAYRAPGTYRTIIITSALVILAAVPYIVQNPLVFGWLLELATLDRAGVTPGDMLEKTGVPVPLPF